jgi:hypothetical protein
MSLREKCFFNGTTICLVPAVENREPVLLCEGQLCEIQRYMGVHCNPTTTTSAQWQYCIMVEGTELTTVFEKINLEKENNTLLFRVAPSRNIIVLEKLVDVCFSRRTQHLIDIRSGVMLETGIFIYDSMHRFMHGINQLNCSAYRFVAEKSYSSLR